MKRLPSLSVVFPAYNDEKVIGQLVKRAASLLPQLADDYEIIVVNDGSADATGEVLAKLQKQTSFLRIIVNTRNLGYGAALITGFQNAVKDFIFYTDGDGQYDIEELGKLIEKMDDTTDIVTGFKISRKDPWFRKIIGILYNRLVKTLFHLSVREVDCDFRLFRRDVLRGFNLTITSGAFDAQFIKQAQKKKLRFKEVAVHHYPRMYGHSQFFNMKSVGRSLWDIFLLWILDF